MKRLIFLSLNLYCFLLFACSTPPQTAPEATTPAQTTSVVATPAQSFSPLVDSLLSVMTIEEKTGQMTQVTVDLILKDNSTTEIDPEKLRTAILQQKVGSILNVKEHAYTAETWKQVLTAIQDVATEESRLKIPILYGIDAIHGANYLEGATLFPHNIGMAASRNPELVKQMAEVTAKQTRASGIPWNFDPVLDVGRQPLWSRFEETFGEDVYLVKKMGVAAIRGYEGESINSGETVASTMKHFLGYSLPASGKDRTPSYIPERILREYVLPPFKAAVDAGAATVMINSGEINGMPVHASKYYLTEILRNELGFEGVAVSDWEDVIRLHERHLVADSPKEAVRLAVEAGLDMSMVPYDYSFNELLIELVKEGRISEERLDVSVGRILSLKEKLGLFNDPYPDPSLQGQLESPEYDSLALKAARQSMTLLKNENNALPLSAESRLLIAGPAANALTPLHSSWSYTWQGDEESRYPEKAKTLTEAFREMLGEGQVISSATNDFEADINYDVEQLLQDAQAADVILLALGEEAYAEGPGSIDDLLLDERQLALAKAAASTGKPVILVLAQGRPRIITPIIEDMDAVLMAYRPSTFGAQAIAEVLLGHYNPSGVLPFTYPRYSGDVVLYDYKGTEDISEAEPNTYEKGGFYPLYSFGHGLSYTTFTVSDLTVDKSSFGPDDRIQLSVMVKNTGQRAGDKIVELYSRDQYASITPSAKRLRAFQRVSLQPGEEESVRFSLDADELAFVNEAGNWVIEEGAFDLMVEDQQTTVTLTASQEMTER